MEEEIKRNAISVLKKAAECWPTSFVARREVKRFTGGLYSTGHLANCDCAGTGPEGSFKIGK